MKDFLVVDSAIYRVLHWVIGKDFEWVSNFINGYLHNTCQFLYICIAHKIIYLHGIINSVSHILTRVNKAVGE